MYTISKGWKVRSVDKGSNLKNDENSNFVFNR